LGEHTKEVLHEAGYSPAEIERFVQENIVGTY
jgi:crotonobetainyl-CoA:carnitine CoA-transferase CaiB-like acyl-CoA transferase